MALESGEMENLRDFFNSKIGYPGIESCEYMLRKSIMHYTDKFTRFIKVTAFLPKYMN